MRKLLRKVAKRLGMSTWYHVAAVYQQDSHIGSATISMICRISPWVNDANYTDLVEYVKSKSTGATATPSIVSVTKLGV